MCVAHKIYVPIPKVKVTSRSQFKIISQRNSKATEANLTKLYRKIKHNEKVCCAQE